MAANYVSYTLFDKKSVSKDIKNAFFDKFYNHLAQGVYHCMKTAFPKNRNMIETAEMKRKLLNTFSELFTGVIIYSAKFSKWDQSKSGGQGAGAVQKADKGKNNAQPEMSLADLQRRGLVKSKRQRVNMRYSPLVERYLLTHNYETMNNVKGWKMLLTQRNEAQKEVDKKFKAYQKIAEQSDQRARQLDLEYKEEKARIQEELKRNDAAAKQHIDVLKEAKKEKLESGGCAEYANLVVSVFNQDNQKTWEMVDSNVEKKLNEKR